MENSFEPRTADRLPGAGEPENAPQIEDNPGNTSFYRAFEDIHRGSRELIKSRLQVYLPFTVHCQELYERCSVLDLGCGRGEWLELMAEHGFEVLGVDLDEGMLAACRERNLPAEQKDALLALRDMPAASRTIVSGFHIAEHLPFDILQEIVKESLRVLQPGGLLILETPNPENILVGTANFYMDPTHRTPLPPRLLSFLPEYYGFARTKIVRLFEPAKLKEAGQMDLLDIFEGVSPDFAVIAQKESSAKRMALFDPEFEKEYGFTLEKLIEEYEKDTNTEIGLRLEGIEQTAGKRIGELRTGLAEARKEMESQFATTQSRIDETTRAIDARLDGIDSSIDEFEACFAQNRDRVDQALLEARVRAESMEAAFLAVLNSRSWRMTAPYRAFGDYARNMRLRLRNSLHSAGSGTSRFILSMPFLMFFLRPFPRIKESLERSASSCETKAENGNQPSTPGIDENTTSDHTLETLSPSPVPEASPDQDTDDRSPATEATNDQVTDSGIGQTNGTPPLAEPAQTEEKPVVEPAEFPSLPPLARELHADLTAPVELPRQEKE